MRRSMRILVAEDDARIADFVQQGRGKSGYSVQTVATRQDAHLEARLSPYDLLVLDLILGEWAALRWLARCELLASSCPS